MKEKQVKIKKVNRMKEKQIRIKDIYGKDRRLCNQLNDGSFVFKNTNLQCTREEAIKALQSPVQP